MADTAAKSGREANRPREMPAAGWLEILRRTLGGLGRDHVPVISAGVAFFGLLAIFPAIAAAISIAGLFYDPTDMQEQITRFAAPLPDSAAEILERQATEVAASDPAAGFGALLGIALALYSASRGVKALMEGMNVAYGEEEERGFLTQNAVALALTLVLILAFVLAVGALLVAPAIANTLDFVPSIELSMTYLPWPVLCALTVVGLAVLYRYGPSRKPARWRWVTPGSTLATVIWLVGSALFSVYVANFGSYNETYGALGGVIILLTWLWLSSFVILLGAELNAEIEHQTGRDTTTGRSRPLARPGASKADKTKE